jgi:degT/dnrJ/eryC1/strS aminotransferase
MGVTMNEVSSYIGCMQMRHIDSLLAIQRRNAQKWRSELTEEPFFQSLGRSETEPNYWVFGLLAKQGRIDGIRHFRTHGYYASSVHLPNYNYSVFGNYENDLPGVREFYEHYLALPCGWWIEE